MKRFIFCLLSLLLLATVGFADTGGFMRKQSFDSKCVIQHSDVVLTVNYVELNSPVIQADNQSIVYNQIYLFSAFDDIQAKAVDNLYWQSFTYKRKPLTNVGYIYKLNYRYNLFSHQQSKPIRNYKYLNILRTQC